MKITIDLEALKTGEDSWSEPTVKALETVTGKPWKEIHSDAKEQSPDIPDGKPSTWDRGTKLSFIDTHGRDEFKRLVRERK